MSNEILDIAARMKELREICEFSPEEMARELNVTPEAYASYESGAIDIPISVLLAMANACHVEPSALLTGGEPKLHVYCLTRAGKGVGIDRRKEYRYKSLAYNFGNKVAEPLPGHGRGRARGHAARRQHPRGAGVRLPHRGHAAADHQRHGAPPLPGGQHLLRLLLPARHAGRGQRAGQVPGDRAVSPFATEF